VFILAVAPYRIIVTGASVSCPRQVWFAGHGYRVLLAILSFKLSFYYRQVPAIMGGSNLVRSFGIGSLATSLR
jgi:hypothetical protein